MRGSGTRSCNKAMASNHALMHVSFQILNTLCTFFLVFYSSQVYSRYCCSIISLVRLTGLWLYFCLPF